MLNFLKLVMGFLCFIIVSANVSFFVLWKWINQDTINWRCDFILIAVQNHPQNVIEHAKFELFNTKKIYLSPLHNKGFAVTTIKKNLHLHV